MSMGSQSVDGVDGSSDSGEVGLRCCKCLRPCHPGSPFGEPGSLGPKSKQPVHDICVRIYKMDLRKHKDKSYKAMVQARTPQESVDWYPYDFPYGQGPVHTALLGELLLGELLLCELLLALMM